MAQVQRTQSVIGSTINVALRTFDQAARMAATKQAPAAQIIQRNSAAGRPNVDAIAKELKAMPQQDAALARETYNSVLAQLSPMQQGELQRLVGNDLAEPTPEESINRTQRAVGRHNATPFLGAALFQERMAAQFPAAPQPLINNSTIGPDRCYISEAAMRADSRFPIATASPPGPLNMTPRAPVVQMTVAQAGNDVNLSADILSLAGDAWNASPLTNMTLGTNGRYYLNGWAGNGSVQTAQVGRLVTSIADDAARPLLVIGIAANAAQTDWSGTGLDPDKKTIARFSADTTVAVGVFAAAAFGIISAPVALGIGAAWFIADQTGLLDRAETYIRANL
jgi:hypothetical protein